MVRQFVNIGAENYLKIKGQERSVCKLEISIISRLSRCIWDICVQKSVRDIRWKYIFTQGFDVGALLPQGLAGSLNYFGFLNN